LLAKEAGEKSGITRPERLVIREAHSSVSNVSTGRTMPSRRGCKPFIVGIPVEIVPLHWHALTVTTKFFERDCQETVVHPYAAVTTAAGGTAQRSSSSSSRTGTGSEEIPGGVIESVLHRMQQQQAADEANSEEAQQRQQRLHRKDDAVKTWLQAIHRWLRDNNHRSRDNNPEEEQSGEKKRQGEPRIRVPVACLEHLWGLSTENRRISVKRAAIHLSGHLLEKTADGRRWVFSESHHLLTWMDRVAAAVGDNSILYKRECYDMLQHLSEGYGDLYPTLSVALQRFRQVCPAAVLASEDIVGRGEHSGLSRVAASEQRWIRDLAMQHADEEERRVQRLIQRAHACMDILVPRIGQDDRQSAEGNQTVAEEEKEEDDSVDWEDGWEEPEDGEEEGTTHTSHAEAVERTLAVMRQSGGILRDGQLEIDFAQQEDTIPAAQDPAKIQARQRLDKAVRILSSRHLPRLTAWVEAVRQADNLVASDTSASALVSMSPEAVRRRNDILRRLLELKTVVMQVLSSANRLGLETNAITNNATEQPRPRQNLHLVNNNNNRNQSLSTTLSRRRRGPSRDITHRRSNRIQIKYRKH
jgi:hypothetical protein